MILMEKKSLNVGSIPKAGPYSHAVEAAGLIFLSGIVPVDPETGNPVVSDIGAATSRVLDNISLILEEVGSSLERAIKTTVYLLEMKDFKAMNEAYQKYFPSDEPARACVAVKELPGNFPVEIDVVALK